MIDTADLTPAQLDALARLRALHRRAGRYGDGWLLVRETTHDGRTIASEAPWGVVGSLARLGLVETRPRVYRPEGYGPRGGRLGRFEHYLRLAPEMRPDEG